MNRVANERRMNAFDHAVAPVVLVLLGVAVLGCLAGIFRAAAIIPLPVPLDPNEGWNAYHAAAAMAGQGLYPGPASFMANNYPPLSFYLVGILGLLTGDQIVAGRIVSFVSFICISGLLLMAVRSMGGGIRGALLSTVLFAAILLLASDYVGMNDPQLLGHALQLAAFCLLVRDHRTTMQVSAASALFVAGGLVKHNLFVLPLATLFWLAYFDRRSAVRLAVWCVAMSVCSLAIFHLLYGSDLLGRLASARLWSFAQFTGSLVAWLPFVVAPLLGLVALVLWRPNDPPVAFVAIYGALGVATGSFMAAGAGVDVNAMFDTDIALALGAGLLLGRLLGQKRALPHLAGDIFVLAALIPFALVASQDPEWRSSAFWVHPMHDETALAAQDIAFLRAHPGRAICETLAFCYWAGKVDPVDVFNLDQQFRTGVRDPATFLLSIGARHFAVIELDETDPFPLPRIARSAILTNYRIDHTDDEGTFLIPR